MIVILVDPNAIPWEPVLARVLRLMGKDVPAIDGYRNPDEAVRCVEALRRADLVFISTENRGLLPRFQQLCDPILFGDCDPQKERCVRKGPNIVHDLRVIL